MPSPFSSETSTLDRRQMLAGGGLLAATAFAGGTAAAQQHVHSDPNHPDLVAAALHCVNTGRACLDHCFEQFKQGDTTLAECVKPVQELVIMCQAIAAMAAYGSPHLKGVAEVTKAVCKDCEAECRKHDNHMACQICADSCAPCMAECDRILDA